jgi:hypothetical protein
MSLSSAFLCSNSDWPTFKVASKPSAQTTLADHAALKDPERRRQATEAEAVGRGRTAISRELIQSGPQCHSAIIPARISNEINGLQGPKNQGSEGPTMSVHRVVGGISGR